MAIFLLWFYKDFLVIKAFSIIRCQTSQMMEKNELTPASRCDVGEPLCRVMVTQLKPHV